ncbi:MAG: 16S rRNA (cytidine(1402)-2'-O)-methyltransferase [Eggerthellaceae bacterium]|nr:16S rRNA (cytidine(1402)-2'-O)-methyltransferase [Eggerthellaceae bacterium]
MREFELYICPTPLGNLADITQRTLDVLRKADVVYAEDTRVTGKLLSSYNIEKPLKRLDEYELSRNVDAVIGVIKSGKVCAYCTDAGMPGISDPGMRLVAAAQKHGIRYTVLPGPSAASVAFVASGFQATSYYFGGFFPRKQSEQDKLLKSLSQLNAALVFYESPRRVQSAIRVVAKHFPFRQVALCRELTKLHEEVLVLPAQEMFYALKEKEKLGNLKGEIVFVISPPLAQEQETDLAQIHKAARLRAEQLVTQEQASHKDIVRILRNEFGIERNVAYDMVQNLKNKEF